jgi:predicted MFS family arabinose efflux permease
VLLAAGLFIVGTNAFVIAGLLPDIAASLGVHSTEVSYSISLYSIIVAVAAPAISILLPRVSRTRLMVAGLVLIGIGTVLAAAASTIELFSAGRIIAALGGAALVPTATASAAAIVPPERRGTALAAVSVGFTLAFAIGSPFGTALGELGGWRVPLFGVAGLALVLAVAIGLMMRDIPVAAPVSLGLRFRTLRDARVVMTLVAALFLTAGFNVVYIFSSVVTAGATGGSGSLLAILLLIYGIAGVVGNLIAGWLTDRLGNRVNVTSFLIAEGALLLALPLVSSSYIGTAILFGLWGIASFASVVPLQHRLVVIDPETSAIALSWYTTAMYIGIGLAPILGAAAFGLGGAELIPIFGGAAIVVSLIAFHLGYRAKRAAQETVRPLVNRR